MKDLLIVAVQLPMLGHFVSTIVCAMSGQRFGRRLSRTFCIPALGGFLALLVLAPPQGSDWLGAAVWPLWWWLAHVRYHKDGHGRRLRDAANGWVQRRGNRLIVVPEAVAG